MYNLLLPGSSSGQRTYLAKANTPLFSTLPGSQKSFFIFYFTLAAESSRSILLSSSEEDILAPVSPVTRENKMYDFFRRTKCTSTVFRFYTHWIHQVTALSVPQLRKIFLGISKDFSLIHSTKLSINLQIFLIQSLQTCKNVTKQINYLYVPSSLYYLYVYHTWV